MAVAFIKSVNRARFEDVATDLENMFLKGTNQYPDDVTSAYKVLTNWTIPSRFREPSGTEGISFAHGFALQARGGGKDRSMDI